MVRAASSGTSLAAMGRPRVIYTIGHSTRTQEQFLHLLQEFGIRRLADVRRFPTSRKFPHFHGAALQAALGQIGIAYRHFAALGGRRSERRPNSPNRGWRVEGFNAYADHMLSPEFQEAFQQLEEFATQVPTAVLCAELVPWRCHRLLLSDLLLAHGWTVLHLLGPGQSRPHELTAFARVHGNGTVTYPAAPSEGFSETQALGPTKPGKRLAWEGPLAGPNAAQEAVTFNTILVAQQRGGPTPSIADHHALASRWQQEAADFEVHVGPGWEGLLERCREGTSLVVGPVNSGKTYLVRWLAGQLAAQSVKTAVVTTDVGQPLFGAPGAMWLSCEAPWHRPDTGWFVGDTTPVGNLVPMVVGAKALVEEARNRGAKAVLVDTTGLVHGPIGRLLKLHKAVVTGAQRVVVLHSDQTPAELAEPFRRAGLLVLELPVVAQVRQREQPERAAQRQTLWARYFASAVLQAFPLERVLTPDWFPRLTPSAASAATGSIAGLLDERLYCVGLAVVEAIAPSALFVRTPVTDLSRVTQLQLGRLKITPDGREVGRTARTVEP
jgi:polynucleotide 5'-kinase involved in rRNA processing